MNDPASQPGSSDTEHNPPPGAPFEEFADWLARHQETETRHPTGDHPSKDTHPLGHTTTEQRIFLSTLPYGLWWVTTGIIAAHMTGHQIDPTRPMIGLALLTWATSIGCEMTRSYAMNNTYPPWGMWEWVRHPATKRFIEKTQLSIEVAMHDGRLLTIVASVTLPAIVAGLHMFSAAVTHAQHLWMLLVVAATALHIGVTAHAVIGREQRSK